MNNIVYQDINFLLESYSVLAQLANPEAHYNIRHKLSTVSSVPPEKEVIYNKLNDYFEAVETNLLLPNDRIDFFFKETGNTLTATCNADKFLKVCLEYNDLSALLSEVKDFTSEERFSHLRTILSTTLGSTNDMLVDLSQHILCEADLFEYIFSATDLSDAGKYELFYIYYHYEQLLEEFIGLIQETSKVISPFLMPFQADIATLLTQITPELDRSGMGYFAKTLGIDLGPNNPYRFYPCVSAALSTTFTNSHGSLDCFSIFFGIYVLPLMALNQKQGPNDKDMADFLKALGDPSKLHILKLLRTERLYASELAEKLGVSNATISHHMNVLLQLHIINYEKEQNKFYYSLEKERFKAYLDQLGAWFTF